MVVRFFIDDLCPGVVTAVYDAMAREMYVLCFRKLRETVILLKMFQDILESSLL